MLFESVAHVVSIRVYKSVDGEKDNIAYASLNTR